MNPGYKIIHLISSLKRGGRERQLSTIVSQCKGHSQFIVSLNSANIDYLNEYALGRHILVMQKLSFISRLIELHYIIKKSNPLVVYTWGNLESILIMLIYPFHNFIWINGSLRHGIRLFRFSHLFRTLILHLSPYIIANSYTGLKANILKSSKRRLVLYNGIDKKFYNSPNQHERLGKLNEMFTNSFDPSAMIFISVANLIPYKDYTTVLSALHKYKSLGNFYYIIVGDGPCKAGVESNISEYGLTEHVFIVGKTEKVEEYLKLADIFIHSSRGEGTSNAILEAMFAGLPIIASNVGGVLETLYPGSSLLFPYKNVDELYSCLNKSKHLKGNFDPHGREYKEHLARFSVETMIENYEEIIRGIVER